MPFIGSFLVLILPQLDGVPGCSVCAPVDQLDKGDEAKAKT